MAQERGYERQTAGVSPVGLPSASPGAFGAGIGAAIADVGGTVHQVQLRSYQIDRQQAADSEAAGFNAAFARARDDADKASIDARNNSAPGGAGHAEQMRQWWQQRAEQLTTGITDDRVRRSAEAQLQEFGGRLGAAEYQWQEGARVGKLVTDQRATRDLAANRVRRLHDPKAFAEELALGRQGIATLEGVPANIRDDLTREYDQAVSVAFFSGMQDRDPASVTRVLDTGAFDDVLSREQMERLRDGARIAVARNEAAARADIAHQASIEKDRLAAIGTDLDAGAGTVDDLRAVAQQYEALGDQSKAAEWKGKALARGAVQGTRDWQLPQMDARIAELTAKQSGAGMTGAEAHELAGMKDQRAATASRLAQPGGALLQLQYATGRAIAPIDPADPASMRARAVQAKAAASHYGRAAAEPILAGELDAFKDMFASGSAGKLQALAAIQGFGDPQVIRAAGAQIAGDDGAFRIAAQLPMSVAREILRGDDTLKTNPKVFNAAQAGPQFNAWYGKALGFVGGPYRTDVFQAARAFYAQRAVDGGETAYNPGRFAEAIETVLGKSGGTGGVARTAQGVVIVPPGMAPDALLQRFARASIKDYSRASGGREPRWSDGSRMTRAQFGALLPTAVDGTGHYGFRAPNGQLVEDDRGNAYVVDVARLVP